MPNQRYIARKAQEDEVSLIKKLANQNRYFLGPLLPLWIRKSIQDNELDVVCNKNGDIVGFVQYHKRRDGWTTIYKVCIAEEHRRVGLATALIQGATKGPASLRCSSKNPAIKLYKKLGFKIQRGKNKLSKNGHKIYYLAREK